MNAGRDPDVELELRARELLAEQFEREGYSSAAIAVRVTETLPPLGGLYGCAVRAIVAGFKVVK